MALIKCTECGKEISDKATTCPNCGAPISSENATSEPVMSPIPEEPKKPKKEKKKGGCLGTVLKIIGALVVIVIVLNIFLGGSDDDTKEATATKTGEVSSSDNSEPDQSNESSDKETTENIADTPEEVNNIFQIGDIVETKDCKISFLSAGEYDTGNEFLQPKEGYVYYQMEFEFENTGDSDLALSSMLGWTCYADDYKVDQTWIGDENGLDGSVSPGKKAKGSVYFEVPADAESIELEYETNFWTEDKIIFVIK